jgi:hypothetical protein
MMERIMQAGRPRLSPSSAAALLGELFGVAADDARDLHSPTARRRSPSARDA